MNKIVSVFARISACTAVIVGAPLIAASTVDFTMGEINKNMMYDLCVDAEKLNKIGTVCKR